jgi:hypothetical protein
MGSMEDRQCTILSHTFDFLHNEYFVEILISRIDKRANPVAYMVRLEETAVIK